MKKLRIFLIFSILFTILLLPEMEIEVSAACNAFEVVDIQTNGSKSSKGCYNSLNDAQNAMWSYTNGAVLHQSSKSPEKIIAATRAVVQAYPYRRSTSGSANVTMNIYQYFDYTVANSKTTYVGSHYEMAYLGTYSYNTADGTGKVRVGLAGFDGYTNIDQVDIIPLVYIENGISMYLGGSTSPASYEQAYISKNITQAYFIVETRNGVNELRYVSPSHYYSASGGRINKANNVIGPAPSWMSVGVRYYSWDMVNFYSDNNYQNKVGTYYNYYMFLPLRSETNVTADQLNAYINSKGYTSRPSGSSAGSGQSQLVNSGAAFIRGQTEYGTNALLVFAMAIHESGYGRSNISVNQNNLFGWAAVDSNPGGATQYSSVEHSISEQFAYNLRGYLDITDGRFFGTHLGEKKSGFNVRYASDPYWGLKIASYAYDIDKYAGLVDYQYYEIAMINSYGIAFKAAASDSATTLATSQYGSTYQEEFMVIVTQTAANNYSQVMFSNGLRSNGSVIVHKVSGTTQAAEYHSFSRSVAYVNNTYLTAVSSSRFKANNKPNPIPGVLKTEQLDRELIYKFDTFTVSAHNLSLSGYGFQYGITSPSLSNVSHKLVFTDISNSANVHSFALADGSLRTDINTAYASGQLDYSGSTFAQNNIDLSKLTDGVYAVSLQLSYNNVSFSKEIALTAAPGGTPESDYTFALVANKLQLTVIRNYERTLYTYINEFNWTGNNKLHVQGVAALAGVSHLDKDKITQTLVFFDINTLQEYRYELESKNHEELGTFYFDLGDGESYYYAWFEKNIDISGLPVGEYQGYLETEIISSSGAKYTGSLTFLNNLAGGIPEVKLLNGNTFHFQKNGKYRSRYELSVRKGMYDLLEDINKPTDRITNFSMENFAINNGILELKGFAYMYNIAHSTTSMPTYSLLFVDSSGNVAAEFALTTNTGSYDITANVNSGHSYTHCWFEGKNIDLSAIGNGSYNIYIAIENGDYYDLIPYTADYKSYTVSGNASKIFELECDEVHYKRMILHVK